MVKPKEFIFGDGLIVRESEAQAILREIFNSDEED